MSIKAGPVIIHDRSDAIGIPASTLRAIYLEEVRVRLKYMLT
ncbi:MAG: hypothetical protein WBL02_06090 [Methanomethylovorans sp.]